MTGPVISDDIAVSVRGVSKSFRLPRERSSDLKQHVMNALRGIKGYESLHVLDKISFDVYRGDFFGIVGRNGSGKSTLLKLIAQIYTPDCGSIAINGSLVPFIELGVGFSPDLTGRENVYLSGAMLGFSNKDVDLIYDDIVDFAELHDFMGQKLKNYSSGMQVRLAFSIAIKAQGDILLLDEVLAVGDEAFQRKCYSYFAELKRARKTVILVTHSMDSVQQFCNRAMLIDKAARPIIGGPAEIARRYRKVNSQGSEGLVERTPQSQGSDSVQISASCTQTDESVTFDIDVAAARTLEDIVITLVVNRDDGEIVYRFVTDEKMEGRIDLIAGQARHLRLGIDNVFCNGVFDVQIGIKSRDRSQEYSILDNAMRFEIVNTGSFPNDAYWKPRETFRLEEVEFGSHRLDGGGDESEAGR